MAEKLTPLKAIRLNCLECMGWEGNPNEEKPEKQVRGCTAYECKFYPFRMGKDPNRKGRGGNPRLKRSRIMSILR